MFSGYPVLIKNFKNGSNKIPIARVITPTRLYNFFSKLVNAHIVSLSCSATGLYIQKATADPKPNSVIFNIVRIDVNKLVIPK